jgi:hypothetical protein
MVGGFILWRGESDLVSDIFRGVVFGALLYKKGSMRLARGWRGLMSNGGILLSGCREVAVDVSDAGP